MTNDYIEDISLIVSFSIYVLLILIVSGITNSTCDSSETETEKDCGWAFFAFNLLSFIIFLFSISVYYKSKLLNKIPGFGKMKFNINDTIKASKDLSVKAFNVSAIITLLFCFCSIVTSTVIGEKCENTDDSNVKSTGSNIMLGVTIGFIYIALIFVIQMTSLIKLYGNSLFGSRKKCRYKRRR